jgi:hypothetical protein
MIRPHHKSLSTLLSLLSFVSAALVLAPPTLAQREGDTRMFLGVRVLKTANAGPLAWSVEFPNCSACALQSNDFTTGQKDKEFFFHFLAPEALKVVEGVRVKVDPTKVRAVIVGFTDYTLNKTIATIPGPAAVTFTKTTDGIVFDVPREPVGGGRLPPYDAGDPTQSYSYIHTQGIDVRIEHADPQRRGGAYATGQWPAVQRQAALNLEFAAREAMIRLGLDRSLTEGGIGLVTLMGFDTCFPTLGPNSAHGDNPPHWHMHMYWNEEPRVRKVGHFYIGEDGLLFQNNDLGRGQTDETKTASGKVLYTHTITNEGYFMIGAPTGSCLLAPILGGFHSGVKLTCNNDKMPLRVRAEDDLAHGRLRVSLDDHVVYDYEYDPDTYLLKSTNGR